MEVVEHVDPPRLDALERFVFGEATPATVIVTTPNFEYNVRFRPTSPARCVTATTGSSGPATSSRAWSARVGQTLRLRVRHLPAARRPEVGPPSQLAVFTRTEVPAEESAWTGRSSRCTVPAVPALSLVVLVGASGTGKSTFARAHFAATEVLSSRTSAGPGRRRRERPVAPPLTRSTSCTTSSAPGSTRPAHRHRRDERPARGPRVSSSRWPASMTSCRSRSCSTFPSRSAIERNAARPDRPVRATRARAASMRARRGRAGT